MTMCIWFFASPKTLVSLI